jgi:hypothetical protein
MREGMLLSEIPMILATSWWNRAVGALWPCSPAVHDHEAFHEGHRQLVVPEPIEEDGEHGHNAPTALFHHEVARIIGISLKSMPSRINSVGKTQTNRLFSPFASSVTIAAIRIVDRKL